MYFYCVIIGECAMEGGSYCYMLPWNTIYFPSNDGNHDVWASLDSVDWNGFTLMFPILLHNIFWFNWMFQAVTQPTPTGNVKLKARHFLKDNMKRSVLCSYVYPLRFEVPNWASHSVNDMHRRQKWFDQVHLCLFCCVISVYKNVLWTRLDCVIPLNKHRDADWDV